MIRSSKDHTFRQMVEYFFKLGNPDTKLTNHRAQQTKRFRPMCLSVAPLQSCAWEIFYQMFVYENR